MGVDTQRGQKLAFVKFRFRTYLHNYNFTLIPIRYKSKSSPLRMAVCYKKSIFIQTFSQTKTVNNVELIRTEILLITYI